MRIRGFMLNTCRVCGYTDAIFFPWGKDGKTPSFEICECCNVEFGYEDYQLSSIRRYRQKWLLSEKFNSDSNHYKNQLKNIDQKYQ